MAGASRRSAKPVPKPATAKFNTLTLMDSETMLNRLQNEYGTAQFNARWVAQDWNWWDMVGYGQAATFNYFSVPAGANDPQLAVTKTTEQTNLVVQNQIGGTECFVATAIRCFVLIAAKARQ